MSVQFSLYLSFTNCVSLIVHGGMTQSLLPRLRRVWRYQSVNQNSFIEEEQTTQWSRKWYILTTYHDNNDIDDASGISLLLRTTYP